MIRLRAKNDAEKADSSGSPEPVHSFGHSESSEMNSSGTDAPGVCKSSGENSKDGEGGVKLLGIGGRRAKKSGKATVRKTPGEIRIQKDVTELDGGEIVSITFPNPNNLCQFKVSTRGGTSRDDMFVVSDSKGGVTVSIILLQQVIVRIMLLIMPSWHPTDHSFQSIIINHFTLFCVVTFSGKGISGLRVLEGGFV